MRIKPGPPDSSANPGPGAYNHDQFGNVLQRSPQTRLGTAKRDDLHSQSVREFPGPGTYEAEGRGVGPKWGFGSEARGKNASVSSPAPGTYEMKSTLDPRGYSMAGKHGDNALREAASVPGPGAYNPSLTDRAPSYGVGRGQRSDWAQGNVNPGPGSYDANARPRSAAPVYFLRSFGTDPRRPMSASVDTPGPGTYRVRMEATEGPQYSMPGRGPGKQRSDTPGPGQYEAGAYDAVLQKAPAFGLGSAKRGDNGTQSMKELPGPGAYEPTGQMKGPKYGFGTQARGHNKSVDTPGAGAYNVSKGLGKIAYTMGSKHDDHTLRESASVPGPGAYNPSLLTPKGNVRVGTGPRSDFAKTSIAPGPGAYSPGMARPSSAAPV